MCSDFTFSPESQTPAAPPDVYDVVWYGTPQLWTMLDAGGAVWSDLPTQADGTLTERTFWWSENYSPDDPGGITVEAKRVDRSAPMVVTTEPAGSGFNPFTLQPTHESVTVIGIDLPGPGCWELSAEYEGATLSYVAWVSND